MITRIYVDNFRTLVDFEWKPGKLVLLLGENGSGKTSILDVLWSIRRLLIDESDVVDLFPGSTLTRWGQLRPDQTFEIDVRSGQVTLRYRLVVHHEPKKPPVIAEEVFRRGEQVISAFRDGNLTFETLAGNPITMPARTTRSAFPVVVGALPDGPTQAFSDFLYQTWLVAPDPRAMSGSAEKEASALARDCANFAAWLKPMLAQAPEAVARAREELHQVLGLRSLQFPKGTTRLMAAFDAPDATTAIDFAELSDGQRQLIVLYVLRHVVWEMGHLVVFDEPDNYLALSEIQPWVTEVVASVLSESGPQVWMVSHHPEILDLLAREYGVQLVRDEGGATLPPRHFPDSGGLAPAALVAGAWSRE